MVQQDSFLNAGYDNGEFPGKPQGYKCKKTRYPSAPILIPSLIPTTAAKIAAADDDAPPLQVVHMPDDTPFRCWRCAHC